MSAKVRIISLLVLAVTACHARPKSITWERDYAKAIERARSEKKLIVADMFTDWCVLCKRMDAETFSDPQLIKKMAGQYVWLKLNTETEEEGKRLQKEFAILTYPTILVLDDQGDEIERVGRFLPARGFTETVASFADSAASLANLKKTIQEQPNSVSARYALAERLLNHNNYPKAAAQFQKVVELDPENREGKTDLSQYNVALSLASQEKFDDAIAQLQLLETKFPNSETIADAAVLRGQVYQCCGQLDRATAIFQEYVKKYPKNGHVEQVKEALAAIEAAKARF